MVLWHGLYLKAVAEQFAANGFPVDDGLPAGLALRTTPRTRADFASCLPTDQDFPPAARAARVYLDVAFFHPIADDNARAALLALVRFLAWEDIVLLEVGTLQTNHYVDDPAGAADLAALLGVLNHRRSIDPHPRLAAAA
ncbi:hypothetical protein ACWDDN_46660 [Streptomyces griseoruber]|uniref:hypothetical protein n=1 Tax=Streptomyces griseoruber TaxID=1943 RepID=UPI000B0E47A0|nr:hypothetical protein [Streptomyces griseoruber]